MTQPSQYFKVLAEDGRAFHGGVGRWHLPRGKRAGKWMPELRGIQPCVRGYHVCEPQDLLSWLGPAIWEVEGRGSMVRTEDKTVFAQARLLRQCEHWTARNARLFAASCARDVLPLFERVRPQDTRVRACIEAAEAFARGEIGDDARAAAWDAAWDAAWVAAWAAAWDAVGAAAGAAAWAAAWDAARSKQFQRLMHLLQTGEIAQ